MSMAMKYAMKKRMAKGGMAHDDDCPGCNMCHGGKMADGGDILGNLFSPLKNEGVKSGFDPGTMFLGKQAPKAAGVDDGGGSDFSDDMVSRIMKHRFSKGGEVANDTPVTADFEDNQFDDLVKDDDLEFSETGKNSGDEDGDEAEDDDRKDIVSRIMKSRKKKDKMPRPA